MTALSFAALVVWWSGVAYRSPNYSALDRLGSSARCACVGERPAARRVLWSRRAGLSAHRTPLARPAGLGPVHDHAGSGGGGVGRGRLSPRRRNRLDLICEAERMAALLRLHDAQPPRHRQPLSGIAAGKPFDPVHSLAVAPNQQGGRHPTGRRTDDPLRRRIPPYPGVRGPVSTPVTPCRWRRRSLCSRRLRGTGWNCRGMRSCAARRPRFLSARYLSVRDVHRGGAASPRPFRRKPYGRQSDGAAILASAPDYCLRLDTNVFFYVHVPLRCLDLQLQWQRSIRRLGC